MRKATGISEIVEDICINSCMAFTGPYEKDDICPCCSKPRYGSIINDSAGRVPCKTFTTILPGPQISAIMRCPELADKISWRLLQINGKITSDDVVLMFSTTVSTSGMRAHRPSASRARTFQVPLQMDLLWL